MPFCRVLPSFKEDILIITNAMNNEIVRLHNLFKYLNRNDINIWSASAGFSTKQTSQNPNFQKKFIERYQRNQRYLQQLQQSNTLRKSSSQKLVQIENQNIVLEICTACLISTIQQNPDQYKNQGEQADMKCKQFLW